MSKYLRHPAGKYQKIFFLTPVGLLSGKFCEIYLKRFVINLTDFVIENLSVRKRWFATSEIETGHITEHSM